MIGFETGGGNEPESETENLSINLTPQPPLRARRGGVEAQRDGGEVNREKEKMTPFDQLVPTSGCTQS